jgi:hypothetical protein
MLKQCRECKKEGQGPKPLTDFNRKKSNKDGLQDLCREHTKNKYQTYFKNNPRYFAEKSLRFNYDLNASEYEALLASQDHRCAICGCFLTSQLSPVLAASKRFVAHVDHDHATGELRGLLCLSCNIGLGKFYDNEQFLLSAAGYLRESVTRQEINRLSDVKAQGKDEPRTRDLDRAQVGERRQVH